MSLNGQKMKNLADKFAASEANQCISWIFKTLETRSLGGKHFQQAHKALETLLDTPKEHLINRILVANIDPSTSLKERNILASMMYFSAFSNKLGMAVPVAEIYQITAYGAMAQSRSLPVRLKYGHIENRFRERENRELNYQSGNMMFNIAFGLMLVQASQHKILSGKQETVPILIPHKDGLFVGKVEAVEHPLNHELIPEKSYCIMHHDKTLHNMTGAHWVPQFETRIYTYVDKSLFSPAQQTMHEILLKYMEDTSLIDGIDNNVRAYLSAKPNGVFGYDEGKIFHALSHLKRDIENPLLLKACSTRGLEKPATPIP